MFDADLRVVGSAPIRSEAGHSEHGWFCGPDRLLTQRRYNLKSWQVGDG